MCNPVKIEQAVMPVSELVSHFSGLHQRLCKLDIDPKPFLFSCVSVVVIDQLRLERLKVIHFAVT